MSATDDPVAPRRLVERLGGRWVVAAMVTGFVVRVIPILLGDGDRRFTFVDSASYLRVARDLGSWWRPDAVALDDSLLRAFGYPAFAWVVSFGSPDPTRIALAQAVLGGVVNVALVAAVARLVFHGSPSDATSARSVAVAVAAWCAALEPATVGHSLLVSPETLATTTLLGATIAGLHAVDASTDADRSGSWTWSALGGLALAATAMVRPEWLYAVPLVAIVTLAVGRSRTAGLTSIAVVAGAAVLLVPWAVRNEAATGDPFLFTTATGQNVFAAGVAAEAADRGELVVAPWRTSEWMTGLDEARTRVEGEHPGLRDYADVVERDGLWRTVGRELLLDHPAGHLQVAGASLTMTALAPSHDLVTGAAGVAPGGATSRALEVGAVVLLAATYVAAALGARAFARRGRRAALLLVPAAMFLAVTAGPHAYSRFRVLVIPAVAVMAGVGAVTVLDRWKLRTPDADAGDADVGDVDVA